MRGGVEARGGVYGHMCCAPVTDGNRTAMARSHGADRRAGECDSAALDRERAPRACLARCGERAGNADSAIAAIKNNFAAVVARVGGADHTAHRDDIGDEIGCRVHREQHRGALDATVVDDQGFDRLAVGVDGAGQNFGVNRE